MKALRSQNSVLRSRTVEDRLRIITEKAAVVLLDEENSVVRRDNEPTLKGKEDVSKNEGQHDDRETNTRQTPATSSQLPFQSQVGLKNLRFA